RRIASSRSDQPNDKRKILDSTLTRRSAGVVRKPNRLEISCRGRFMKIFSYVLSFLVTSTAHRFATVAVSSPANGKTVIPAAQFLATHSPKQCDPLGAKRLLRRWTGANMKQLIGVLLALAV